jgi:hypothetical protein
MSELEDKLNQVLSSPDTMEQIMSLARSLGGGESSSSPSVQETEPSSPAPLGLPNLLSMLGGGQNTEGGIDPRMANVLLRVMTAWNEPDDQKTALLYALRPFLKKERADKIQRAVQITKISHVIRVALDALKGGGDVV